MVVPAKPRDLLAFGTGQAVGASALVAIGLRDPVADRLLRGFQLRGDLRNRSSAAGKLDELVAKLRRVRRANLGIVNISRSKDQVSTKPGLLQW